MKYKVGDKVRVSKCNVEILKGQIDAIKEIYPFENSYKLSRFEIRIAESTLRPAEFKIWCETEEEKQAVLEELEKEGYVWIFGSEKPKEFKKSFETPMFLGVINSKIYQGEDKFDYERRKVASFTPSEFTGLDFSKKIIITKTATGATATYGDKTVTTEGEFEEAARQALAEALCPFKVGDKVRIKINPNMGGEIKKIYPDMTVRVVDFTYDGRRGFDEIEPYIEPPYNAKLFCISGSPSCFKEGYVYEIRDGKFTDRQNPIEFKNLEEINSTLTAKFMEIKGGLNE